MKIKQQNDKIKFVLGLNKIPSLTKIEWNDAYRTACRTNEPVHGLTREQLRQVIFCFPFHAT
jgi:hypothetical protein